MTDTLTPEQIAALRRSASKWQVLPGTLSAAEWGEIIRSLPCLLEERDQLRAELAQAREQERKAIVAYIWQEADKRLYSARTWLRFLANDIKRGKHNKRRLHDSL